MNHLNKIIYVLVAFTLLHASCQDAQAIKLKQYQAQGRALYLQHCSSCHQPDGKGLVDLYPPVAFADYIEENLSKAICITKKGMAEEITVNGKTYNLPMPANKELTTLEVAEIVTYISTEWGSRQKIITVQEVEQAFQACRKSVR